MGCFITVYILRVYRTLVKKKIKKREKIQMVKHFLIRWLLIYSVGSHRNIREPLVQIMVKIYVIGTEQHFIKVFQHEYY